jgi:polyhydroxybutyrate depolymerase
MLKNLFTIYMLISTTFLFDTYAYGGLLRNIGFGGKDYRIPLVEIKGPSLKGSYGPGNYLRVIEFGGRKRFYEIHVPPQYIAATPTPVVMVFHGGGGYPAAVRYQSGMDGVSDRHGFIVVYPAGTGLLYDRLLTWNGLICCGYAWNHHIDDVGFTRAVLDDLGRYFHLDTKRVYATGISNGAILTYLLARELSDRIAAIGPVAGLCPPGRTPGSRPVPIIHFHGTADKNYPFEGGVGPLSATKTNFESVPSVIRAWVAFYGLPPTPSRTFTRGVATCAIYGPGKSGIEIVQWTINGGGHTWPGGKMTVPEKRYHLGMLTRDINASELMWEFFQNHPMQ